MARYRFHFRFRSQYSFGFGLFQHADPGKYMLQEVLLDKGVTEKPLNWNDRPWHIVNNIRKVGFLDQAHANIVLFAFRGLVLVLVHSVRGYVQD